MVIQTATAHNLGGHTVHGTGHFIDEDGAKSFNINVSELPTGTYIIKMSSEGMVQSRRFVKK